MLALTLPIRSHRSALNTSSHHPNKTIRLKHKEKSSTLPIYVRKYSPEHKRIQTAYLDFKDGHLETGNYDPHPPNHTSNWLRTSPANSLKLGKGKTVDLYDLEPVSTKAKKETFRKNDREKWSGIKEFLVSTRARSITHTPNYMPEPYKGKSPAKILRSRDKDREIDMIGFRMGKPERSYLDRKRAPFETKYLRYLMKSYCNQP